MDKCFYCKGKVIKKSVNHLHTWGDKFILFESIDAEVCEQCREVYFSPEVLELIDNKTQNLIVEKTIEIPVVTI